MIVREPVSPGDFEAYYQLRWEMLRKPWGHPRGSELDAEEKTSFHLMALDEQDHVIAVARLQNISPAEGQVRFMAVRDDQQGKGVGKMIMQQIEVIAKEKGLKRIMLQSRENAVRFYESIGYINKEKTFKLWDIIQHYRMEKDI